MRQKRHGRDERLRLAKQCLDEGMDLVNFATVAGFQPSTVENWLSEFKKEQRAPNSSSFLEIRPHDNQPRRRVNLRLHIGQSQIHFEELPDPSYLAAIKIMAMV